MSKTEARQHFGSAHIYWHGRDHCWDSAPRRPHHRIPGVQRKRPADEVWRKTDQPKWRDSMSEMLAEDKPGQAFGQTSWVDRWVDIEPPQFPMITRWVDIDQVRPPPIIERQSGPMVSPRTLMLILAAIALALTLATIELLFRGMPSE